MGLVNRLIIMMGITCLLTSCSLDASISSLTQVSKSIISAVGRVAISPSHELKTQDQFGEYRIEGAFGEVVATEDAFSHDGAYRAEISVRFELMGGAR